MKRRNFLQLIAVLAGVPFVRVKAAPELNKPVGLPSGGIPVGMIQLFSGRTPPPPGWLPCDGQVVSSNDFPELHALLGPPGKIPFTLPQMNARMHAVPGHLLLCGSQGEPVYSGLQYIIKAKP